MRLKIQPELFTMHLRWQNKKKAGTLPKWLPIASVLSKRLKPFTLKALNCTHCPLSGQRCCNVESTSLNDVDSTPYAQWDITHIFQFDLTYV